MRTGRKEGDRRGEEDSFCKKTREASLPHICHCFPLHMSAARGKWEGLECPMNSPDARFPTFIL